MKFIIKVFRRTYQVNSGLFSQYQIEPAIIDLPNIGRRKKIKSILGKKIFRREAGFMI